MNQLIRIREKRRKLVNVINQQNINLFGPAVNAEETRLDQVGIMLICSGFQKDKSVLKSLCTGLDLTVKEVTIGEIAECLFFADEDSIGFFTFPNDKKISLRQEDLEIKRDSEFAKALETIENELPGRDFLQILNLLNQVDTAYRCHILHIEDDEDYFLKEYYAHFSRYESCLLEMIRDHQACEIVNTKDHIKVFSKIYFQTIETILQEVGFSIDLTVHDAGTSRGFFSFILSALANRQHLAVKEILASDISTVLFHSIKCIDQYHHSKNWKNYTHLIYTDFTNDRFYLPVMDITVCIHVLEHLKDEKTAKQILKKLWDRTSRLLIVNVPLEKIPDVKWGHNISFSPEKLEEWGRELTDGTLISPLRINKKGQSLQDEGFLIIKRMITE